MSAQRAELEAQIPQPFYTSYAESLNYLEVSFT